MLAGAGDRGELGQGKGTWRGDEPESPDWKRKKPHFQRYRAKQHKGLLVWLQCSSQAKCSRAAPLPRLQQGKSNTGSCFVLLGEGTEVRLTHKASDAPAPPESWNRCLRSLLEAPHEDGPWNGGSGGCSSPCWCLLHYPAAGGLCWHCQGDKRPSP